MCVKLSLAGLLIALSIAAPGRAAPVELFDGKSLGGWSGAQQRLWRVADGALAFGGTGKVPEVENWLLSAKTFTNFDLRFKAKVAGFVGTGMFFRSELGPSQRIVGWQLDVGQDYDGGLYREGSESGMIAYPAKELVQRTVKPGEWNEYRVRADGRQIQTWVNGVVMATYQERGNDWRRNGHLALEMSAYGNGAAFFKDIVIDELPATAEGPIPAEGPASRMTQQLAPPRKIPPWEEGKFSLGSEDVVVFTGSENMVLEQRSGWLEARLAAHWAAQGPRFRHMSWEGDTVFRQNRMMAWGSWPENLTAAGASVVVAWFGQVEAMDASKSADDFAQAYGALLDEFSKVTPRIVIVAAPRFETPRDFRVPDNTKLNLRVHQFNEAARKLARERGLVFVETMTPPQSTPLTRDGMHFTEAGQAAVGKVLSTGLGATAEPTEALRLAIVEKNRLWFDTWRCMNWTFAFGDRTTQPFAQGTGERAPLVQELQQHQPLLGQAEARVKALAKGDPAPVPNAPLPERPDPPAVSVATEMANFKLREGFEVSLFADETLGVVRPIQIRWDERGRLWVACTPAYPQLQPGEHGNDHIVILEDVDGDGKADRTTRFAEHLTMPMGFEFVPEAAGGGLYVCESTQLVHLPDADKNDRADGHTVVLSGFGTGDTHQDANSLRWGPDGCLWFTQGYHIWSYVETPHGLAELNRSGVWRFNPRTLQLDSFLNESTAGLNCWGTGWDDFGQIFHGSGADTQIWFTTPALVPTLHPLQLPTGMAASKGKSMEPEFLGSSHLPDDLRGVLLKSTYYTSQVQLYRLRDVGSGFASEELGDLMSGNTEFRPVETRVGPDGALYVCDWLNPVIGHYQASYRDPRRDRSHGRIWRVTAKNRPLIPRVNFAAMSETELVAHLTSKERWERDVAKFTLYRRPGNLVLAAVSAKLKSAEDAADQEGLLYELSGVLAAHEAPDRKLVLRLMASKNFRYRAWGVHLVGVWGHQLAKPVDLLAWAIQDEHPRVRLEVVVACSWMPAAVAVEAMQVATLAMEQPTDAPINYALTQCIHALAKYWQPALQAGKLDFGTRFHALARVLTTVGDNSVSARVRELLTAGKLTPGARDSLLTVLIENGTAQDADFAIAHAPESQAVMDALVAVAWRKRDVGYGAVLGQLLQSPHRAARIAGCRIVATTGQDFGTSKRIHELLADEAAAASERAAALGAVAKLRGKSALSELLKFAGSPDPTLRTAALAAAAPLDATSVAQRAAELLGAAQSVAEIGPFLTPLLRQQNGPGLLAKALTDHKPAAAPAKLALQWMGEIGRDDAAVRQALQGAAGINTAELPFSAELIKRLVTEASQKGDITRGAALFKHPQSTCLACHKVGNEGGVLGPDLSAIAKAMTPEAIVESVLWPKRQVKEGFLLTQITTKSGQVRQGYRTEETAESLTLKEIGTNTTEPIQKSDLASRHDVGTLMPEALTSWMSAAERLDLLQYLFQLGK